MPSTMSTAARAASTVPHLPAPRQPSEPIAIASTAAYDGRRVNVVPVEQSHSERAYEVFRQAEAQGLRLTLTAVRYDSSGGTAYFRITKNGTNVGERIALPVPSSFPAGDAAISRYLTARNEELARHLKKHLPPPPVPREPEPKTTPAPRLPQPGPVAQSQREEFFALNRDLKRDGFAIYRLDRQESDRDGNSVTLYQVREERPGATARNVGAVIRIPGRTSNREGELIDASTYKALREAVLDRLGTHSEFVERRNYRVVESQVRTAPHGIAELVTYSRGLSREEQRRGYELRAGRLLEERVNALMKKHADLRGDLTPDTIRTTRMSLLHTLQEIDRQYPGYLQSRESHTLERLTLGLARQIAARQTAELNAPLIQRGDKVLFLLGHESMFDPKAYHKIAEKYGLSGWICRGHAGARAADSTAVKESYLQKLEELVLSGKRTVVWNYCHGGDTGMTISAKPQDDKKSAGWYLEHDEVARKLVQAEITRLTRAGATGTALDLSRITYIFEGCNQFNMARNSLHQAIHRAAEEQGYTVSGLPRIVTPGQRGMVVYAHNREVEPGTKAWHGPIASGVLRYADGAGGRPGSYRVRDFVDGLDRRENDVVSHALRTFDYDRDKTDPRGHLRAQDPTVFSTTPLKLADFLHGTLDMIGAGESERPKTLAPRRAAPQLLEIARGPRIEGLRTDDALSRRRDTMAPA